MFRSQINEINIIMYNSFLSLVRNVHKQLITFNNAAYYVCLLLTTFFRSYNQGPTSQFSYNTSIRYKPVCSTIVG